MKTSHRMFLKRVGKRGHEDVLVVVDWTGLSDADLKLMAAHYVLNRAAHDLKGYDSSLPDSVEYRAEDFIHNEPLVNMPEVPDKWKKSKPSKASQEVRDALAKLSPEERQTLFAGVK